MSRTGKFQRIASHSFIEAACVASRRDGTIRVESSRGAERFKDLFPSLITIMFESGEKDVRAVLQDITLVAMREGDQAIAVAFLTGSSISKSVRRMIRKALKDTSIESITVPEDNLESPALKLVK